MAAVGQPRENGYAERLVRTIKEEEVELSEYQDFADAYRRLARFLETVYNVQRIHSALGYSTPREFEARAPVGRPSRPRLQSPLTGAEDRATVGTDPSADSGAKTAGGAARCRPAPPGGIGTKR